MPFSKETPQKWVSIIYTSEKKLLTKPPGEPEVKIRKLAKKTSHSRSVNKKTIIYTSEAFPAAVASQASKASDLHTVEIIWFSNSKQKQKIAVESKTTCPIMCLTGRVIGAFKHDDLFLVDLRHFFLALCLVSKEKLIPGLSGIVIWSLKTYLVAIFFYNY